MTTVRRTALVACLVLFAAVASAQDRSQARSMTITQRGIVATAQTLASQAGAQILARGGSAVDAAITANAVLGLVEPMMNGIGGDLFALVWDSKTGKLTGINASGWAPKALTISFLRAHGMTTMPSTGIHTVTVPGCVKGWEAMHKRFGRLPWRELFQPAIYYAEHGFPVTELIQYDWDHGSFKLDENARKLLLPGGAAPATGQVFRNPDLGHAYRLIAALGAQAFYSGPVGEAILKTSKQLGGTMTAEDLRDFEPEWVAPISTDYRGWKIYELPPNGQGVGTLEMLNIIEQFPIADYGQLSADAFHVKIEAQKLATQDLKRYVADPRMAKVPLSGLLSKDYARQRAALIDMRKANCETEPGKPPRATRPISASSTRTATSRPGSKATPTFGDRAFSSRAWASSFTTAALRSKAIRSIPTRSPATSARSTPSFPALWSAAQSTSASGSCAA